MKMLYGATVISPAR